MYNVKRLSGVNQCVADGTLLATHFIFKKIYINVKKYVQKNVCKLRKIPPFC